MTEQEENPYQPPESAAEAPPTVRPAKKGKDPFEMQVAKFSLYSPFIMFLLSCVLQTSMREQRAVAMTISVIVTLTTLAAFAMGFVGLVLGIKRKWSGVIIRSIGGIFLNGGLLALFVMGILSALRLRANMPNVP